MLSASSKLVMTQCERLTMVGEFYYGKRLSYDRNLCTVRYVGEVQGTKGQWLGVEWDDPTRGKHSGDYGGVKYYDCMYCFSTNMLILISTFGLIKAH